MELTLKEQYKSMFAMYLDIFMNPGVLFPTKQKLTAQVGNVYFVLFKYRTYTIAMLGLCILELDLNIARKYREM